MSDLQFSEQGWEDFNYWLTQDKKTLKKIVKILEDIKRNRYEGIGKSEALKGNLNGYWSRRIDDYNRIVYRVDGETIKIVQCGLHYHDN